jgi:hypothetical protein
MLLVSLEREGGIRSFVFWKGMVHQKLFPEGFMVKKKRDKDVFTHLWEEVRLKHKKM